MPSQFRFLGSEASSVLDMQKGSPETIAPPPVTESSAHILPSQTPPLPANAEAVDDNQGPSSGLHDMVKKTDFWFNIQLSQSEKYAVDMAIAWANAGIPRQDAPLDGELPIETTLKARAQETFREWIARVKRKIQDAIQSASNDAGEGVIQFRHGLTQLKRTTIDKIALYPDVTIFAFGVIIFRS